MLPAQFRIVATPMRENPHDALITSNGADLKSLPDGARLGTSSPRRQLRSVAINSALEVLPLRGNVDTRLQRVPSGEIDAIILAIAGLKRLGRLADLNYEELDERDFIPTGGAGRRSRSKLSPTGKSAAPKDIERAVAALNDPQTRNARRRPNARSSPRSCFMRHAGRRKGELSTMTTSHARVLFSPDGCARSRRIEISEDVAPGDAQLRVRHRPRSSETAWRK